MKATQSIILVATLSLVGISTANADTGKPGRKGTITVYGPSPSKVISSKRCARKKYTWDYMRCGTALRARVKAKFCATKGKGTHRYYYQVGNGKKSKSSVYCKSGQTRTTPARDASDAGTVRTSGRAGRKGTVAAYFPSRLAVFDTQRCTKRRSVYQYANCGKALRDRVKRRLCARKGKGRHAYYYQVSDSKKRKSSVYCR